MRLGRFLLDWWVQLFIGFDQLLNAILLGSADETLSARAYRADRDGLIFGRIFRPTIDLLFFWQGEGHCHRAYLAEWDNLQLPREYR